MTSAPTHAVAVAPEELPLDDSELWTEPLAPFTWRTTLYSAVAWPLPALSIFFWYGVLKLADWTFWDVGKMLRVPRFAAQMTMWLGGVRVRVGGAHNLDRNQTYLFISNHVSMFDAPVAAAGGVINARSFQQASHLSIPVYGGFVKMFDQVLIDWKDPASKARAHGEALTRLQCGESFGVFPEGQRSDDGKLGPFYDGAFRLAIEAQVPVMPCALRGLRNICPPGEWRARPGVVDVLYGDAIPTAGMSLDDVERLKRRSRRAVNDLLRSGAAPRP